MKCDDYYKAYDLRYKQVHQKALLWELTQNTPLVEETIAKYQISKTDKILDLGCGEGRDAIYLLKQGYNVTAVDYSWETINKCNELTNNKFKNNFKQLDIIQDKLPNKYKFIYSISVLHMFVLQKHRDSYLKFIYDHLENNGIALITVLGNGKESRETDIKEAFFPGKRIVQDEGIILYIANTSCKIVSWTTLEKEIQQNNLKIEDKYISHNIPGFNNSMCVIIKHKNIV